MLSHTFFLAIAALASCARAEKIFAVDFDVVASRVAVNNDLTTYVVACPSSADTSSCNFIQPYTLVQGPSTVSFAITVPNAQTATLECTLPASTALSCSATAITPAASHPITFVATSNFAGAGITSYYKDVSIVTDSADLLTYSPSATSSATSASVTASSSSIVNATESGSFGSIVGTGMSSHGAGSAKSTGGVASGGANLGGGSSDSIGQSAAAVMNINVVGLVAGVALVAAMFC